MSCDEKPEEERFSSPPPLSKSSSEEGDDFFDSVEGSTAAPIEQKVDNDVLIDSKDTVVTDAVSVILNENERDDVCCAPSDAATNDDNKIQTGNVIEEEETLPQIVLTPSENVPAIPEIQKTEVESETEKVQESCVAADQSVKDENLITYAERSRSASKDDIKIETGSIVSDCESTDGGRGGKYRKKAAPSPPVCPPPSNSEPQSPPDTQPIKATLVLKPGVVKPIESPTKSEVFVSRSPKPKHKELSPIAKLKLLPKKLNFWHKDPEPKPEAEAAKRASWHEENLALKRNQSELDREKSKSNEVLITQRPDDDSEDRVVGNLVLRQLSESPSRKKTEKH